MKDEGSWSELGELMLSFRVGGLRPPVYAIPPAVA